MRKIITERFMLDASNGAAPIDMHKEMKRKNITKASADNGLIMDGKPLGLGSGAAALDWNTWLPFAAKQYQISPNIEDYLVVPVLTIPSDLPNRNGVAFPLQSLVRFSTDTGQQAYKTFKGKPTLYEHSPHDDPTKAKGVILDTYLRPFKYHGIWRLLELLAFDRTKDRQLAEDIRLRRMNSYSMGAFVDYYTCSYCGAKLGECSHIPADHDPSADVVFYNLNGKMVFLNCNGVEGFETSAVADPAFVTALNDNYMDLSTPSRLENKPTKAEPSVEMSPSEPSQSEAWAQGLWGGDR